MKSKDVAMQDSSPNDAPIYKTISFAELLEQFADYLGTDVPYDLFLEVGYAEEDLRCE